MYETNFLEKSLEMELLTWVRVLDEAVWILFCANALYERLRSHYFFSPAMGK